MSKCELIELKDLSLNDPIELAAPASRVSHPPVNGGHSGRFHVVRLVGDNVSIETPKCPSGEAGAGHDFHPDSHTHLTWCDLCGEFIWGLLSGALRCSYCNYTCHYRCRPFIQLDCSVEGKLRSDQTELSLESDTNVDEKLDGGRRELTFSETQQKVKEYNSLINSNLYMVMNKDGSYTGFIKVHFQLLRPISLPESPSEEEPQQLGKMKRRTSFYLPKDTAKHLHISSQTRVREVIEALLNKFTMVDNPAKFALFERSDRHNQVYMRKLSDDERPLCLRLRAGPCEKVLSLVLKENETGEVNWDAFSFPELCNFLRILQREEEEHVRQIARRYARARDMMTQALAEMKKMSSCS
ncbi:ras association domain-containing protein 1 [Synchiropus splendidus]|uniref:ras association domain-containing protein 1 n=1 Tax=Synchiropus splendidus TaxID=270530 RepID=UPI00237E1771|nr:ras association domain-containing protein 1 [Synchiropus splendidus]